MILLRFLYLPQITTLKGGKPRYIPIPGLEKLTNANRSVSSVNDRLFPVELTEIADLKSVSEYMLHSNFGKALIGVIGGKFGANTFILPLPCLLNICLSFWVFYRRKEYLNKIKNTLEFLRKNSCCFRRQAHYFWVSHDSQI